MANGSATIETLYKDEGKVAVYPKTFAEAVIYKRVSIDGSPESVILEDSLKDLENNKVDNVQSTSPLNLSINHQGRGQVTIEGSIDSASAEKPGYMSTEAQTFSGTKTFIKPIIGNLTGNADSATKATQDGNGNIITDTYMTKVNPTGTGSFSLNREADTDIGDYSVAIGYNSTASGDYSHAEGRETTASGLNSHAEGYSTDAIGDYSHTEGLQTMALGNYQHVQGKWNLYDLNYAHIVGNGVSSTERSNAHTLDWDGNAWFAGDITIGEDNKEVALKEDLDEYQDITDVSILQLQDTKADRTEIPTTLPNPYNLTINGISYDGSSPITINTTNIFDVTVTVDIDGNCTADKTYTELKTAYDNGNILIANVIIADEIGPQGEIIYQLAAVSNEDEDSMPMGNMITFSNNSFSNIEGQKSIIFYSTGLIVYNETNPVMSGATDLHDGSKGLVPTPTAGDHEKFLRGDGTWSNEFTNLILISPDNSRFKITVDNDGVLSAIKLTE